MPNPPNQCDIMYVVYEDDAVGVVWKPRNMKTAPEHANQKTSAQEESAKLLSPSKELDALPVALACYTLDTAVEGLLVMAKTVSAKARCESAEVSLRFQALISGRVHLPVSELRSVRQWQARCSPNDDAPSRRQYRAKRLCVHYNADKCYPFPEGSDPLRCAWTRCHECAGCGGKHSFVHCPAGADMDIQVAAEAALARACVFNPPDVQVREDATRPTTSMRLDSTTRCMGGDTFISAVELAPAHGFHANSVLSEQLLAAGHPIHPQDKLLKGRYTGTFLACTGVTVPMVDGAGCLMPPLVLDLPAPVRFERLLKKEDGFFAADRSRAEVEYEACGYPAPDCDNPDGGMPVQYQTGLALFCGRRYLVTPDVLIPRPCYEPIVAGVLQHLRPPTVSDTLVAQQRRGAILDLGCGSGCLLLACLAELPLFSGVGLDLCPKALLVSKGNAERFDDAERCEWMENDFNTLPDAFESITEGFDAIVFNPPYLERGAWLSSSCQAEPDLALFVESKYDAYRAVELGLRQCKSMGRPLLSVGGLLAIGLGSGHCKTVSDIYEAHGDFRCEDVLKDPTGIERCIVLRAV